MNNPAAVPKVCLRNPQFRSKLVLDQLMGPGALSKYHLKKLTSKETGDGVRHFYSPGDVRRAKLGMLGVEEGQHPLVRPKIINARMAKGGTGKTTTAANTATALSFMGYRVLCIDGDPQASLTNLLGVDSTTDEEIPHVGKLLQAFSQTKGEIDIASSVTHVFPEGMLDLIPSDITMSLMDGWLMSQVGRDTLFDRMIDANLTFFGQYDVIVIDSAPGTTLLSYNFMAASETLLAVVWLDRESLKAVKLLMANVDEINQSIAGKNVDIEIVANGFHQGYRHCKESIATLAASYRGNLNENVIPHYTGFSRQQELVSAESHGALVEQDPFSPGAKVMFDLAKSLLARYQIMLAGAPETLIPQTRLGNEGTKASTPKTSKSQTRKAA